MTSTIQLSPTARLMVDVMVAAAGTSTGGWPPGPERRLSAVGLDGGAVVAAAMACRQAAVMVSLHRAGRLDLPADLAGRLLGASAAATAASMLLERRLVELDDAFRAEGVRFLVFKGVALARTIYPRSAWRPYGDLDLLIHREDYGPAERALGRMGLRPSRRMSIARRLRHFNAVEFVDPSIRRPPPNRPGGRRRSRVVVDLHWNDGSASWTDHSILTGEAVWTESRPFTLDGVAERTFRTLCPQRSLAHLCGHWGYHHQFAALAPLMDLLLLMGRLGEQGVQQARRLAGTCDCGHVMDLSLRMIEALTGLHPPGGPGTGRDARAERMVGRVGKYMARGGAWRKRWIKFTCLDGPRARRRALRSFLATRLPG